MENFFQFYTEQDSTLYTAQKSTFENRPVYIVMWDDVEEGIDSTVFECETVEDCVDKGFWIKK